MENLSGIRKVEESPEMVTLARENLTSFINGLLDHYRVFGPVRKESEAVFKELESAAEVELDYRATILSPKKYFHQPYQSLFSFREGEIMPAEEVEEEFVLFGVHPCDVNAIEILDTVFKSDYDDVHYLARREKGIVIAVNCTDADDECFCLSWGTGPELDAGYDLLLTDIGGKFVVETGSEKGAAILADYAPDNLLSEVSHQDLKLQAARLEATRYKLEDNLNVGDREEVPQLLARNYYHSVWEELKDDCLACGACTMVCPTCFCFTITDQVDLSLSEGERRRVWDSCMLLDFSEVALGVNFREDRAARIKQRIYHKLYTMEEQFDVPGCVGCGRCIKTCVKDIDLREVINRIREGEENEG